MRFTHITWCRGMCLILFLALPISTTAQQENASKAPRTLTLKQALTLTLANNPQLYRYNYAIKELEALGHTKALRPALALEIEAENFAGSGTNNRKFDALESTVALSSVIELGNKRKARISHNNAQIHQREWERRVETLSVLGELTELFIQGLATQANLRLAQESLNLTQRLLETVKSRAARGATSEAEVMRSKAALARAEISLTAVQKQLQRQKVRLTQYWGETRPHFDRLEGDLFAFGKTRDFEELYSSLQASPVLQVLSSEARLKDAEIKLARAQGHTNLNWRAGIKQSAETDDLAFTASVSLPLFTSKRSQGAINAAFEKRNALDSVRSNRLLQLHARLFEAFSLRQQSITAVNKTSTVAIPALEKALKLTIDAYEHGRYSYPDLIAAQKELLASKQALIDSATAALLSQAVIEKLTGETLNL